MGMATDIIHLCRKCYTLFGIPSKMCNFWPNYLWTVAEKEINRKCKNQNQKKSEHTKYKINKQQRHMHALKYNTIA